MSKEMWYYHGNVHKIFLYDTLWNTRIQNTNTVIKTHCLGMSWCVCVCIIPYFTSLLMITITYILYIHYSFQHLLLSISMYYTFCRVRFVGARTTRHSQTFTQTDNNNYNNNIHKDYNIPFKVQSISSLYTWRELRNLDDGQNNPKSLNIFRAINSGLCLFTYLFSPYWVYISSFACWKP